jgi:hypothetical protein
MAVIEDGSAVTGGAAVDSDDNLTVNLPYDTTADVARGGGVVAAGFAALVAENDQGTITGSRFMRALEVSRDYRLRIGQDSLALHEHFASAAINTAIWFQSTTTATITMASTFVNLNGGLSVANGAVARLTSYRFFSLFGSFPIHFQAAIQFAQQPQANNVSEWGLFLAVGTAAPTEGVFFRLNATGEFRCVINTNGTEVQSGTLNFATLVGTNTTRTFLIYIAADVVDFWIDNILVASIPLPAAAPAITVSPSLPVAFRVLNSGVAAAAQVMRVGAVSVRNGDIGSNKPWAHLMALAGLSAYQGQTGGTMGTSALLTNSLAPGAGAVMTNTTAALGSGLGGQFAALPTLAANTDGILCSFQNPAGTTVLPGRNLVITGVRIQGAVTTVLVGNATPVIYAYSLAFGHTAVSLATAEAAGTKAPRRVALGYESYAAAAAVGSLGQGVAMSFAAPVVVNPGEFIAIAAKNVGVVTTTGVITFLVTFDGYYE